MSHAIFKLNPPVDVERVFHLHRLHPHNKCHVLEVRVESHASGSGWMVFLTEKGFFSEEMDAGLVFVACERPL